MGSCRQLSGSRPEDRFGGHVCIKNVVAARRRGQGNRGHGKEVEQAPTTSDLSDDLLEFFEVGEDLAYVEALKFIPVRIEFTCDCARCGAEHRSCLLMNPCFGKAER